MERAEQMKAAEEQSAMPQAVVLCGGFGTRLQTVYRDGPKALVPIAGRPLLSYALEWLRSEGIGRVVLCVGYKHEQIEELFAEGGSDPEIRYSVEQEPLGTAGAVKQAESAIEGDCFFVLNGDSFLDVPLRGDARVSPAQGSGGHDCDGGGEVGGAVWERDAGCGVAPGFVC